MSRVPGLRRVFRLPFGATSPGREIDEELQYHLDRRTAELVGEGMDARTASDLAHKEFGDLARITDECRAIGKRRERTMRWREMWETVRHDVVFAVRQFVRSPGFTVVAILTLALGISATTAVFTVINGVLLRPLPYGEADRLVMVWNADAEPDPFEVTGADYLDWREQSTRLEDLAAFNVWSPTVLGDEGAERVSAGVVTGNLFQLLGVNPMLGTGFTREHDIPGNSQAVVLSHRFWQRWFGGDPDVLGRALLVNGDQYDIVGVMPPTYHHVDPSQQLVPAQFWAPIAFDRATAPRSGHSLRVVGRLQPGTTLEEVQTEMSAIARRLELAYPETNGGETAVVLPLREQHYGAIRPALLIILGAAGFVLLIVCANVGALVLARSHGRRREFTIRTSLGAGKARLVRQLIVEHTVLAIGGGAIGLLMVKFGADLLRSLQGSFLSGVADIRVDMSVVAFVIGASLAVGVVFGLLPLAQLSGANLRDVLNEGNAGAGTGGPTHRFRNVMVVAQVGLAVVLLIGASLLTRSFLNLVAVPPGFETHSALTVQVTAPQFRYPDGADRVGFFEELTTTLEPVPGVQGVALVSDLPFTPSNRYNRFSVEGIAPTPREVPLVEYRTVGPDYFRVMGIAVMAGREFRSTDRGDAPSVALINLEMARANGYQPGASPVGRELVQSIAGSGQEQRATIVGVVEDVLDDGFDSRPEPRVYFPYMQRPSLSMTAVLKTSVEPESIEPAVRQRVRALDAMVPMGLMLTMRDLVSETLSTETLAMRLGMAFSVLGVLLAAIGVYGLMAFVVDARKREFAIRVALGARSTRILGMVLQQSLYLTLLGIAAGVVVAAGVMRLLSSLLFGVAPFDPFSFVAAPLVLGIVALAAAHLPARRAVRSEPLEALRVQ